MAVAVDGKTDHAYPVFRAMCNKMIAEYPKVFEAYQFSSKTIKEHLKKSSMDGTWAEMMDIFSCATTSAYDKRLFNHEPEVDNIRASRDRLNIQIQHSDLPLASCEQRLNILVNVNEILTKTALENLKYMNIYNSLLRKKLCLPPSDPKLHCEPRRKLEMSTYPFCTNCGAKLLLEDKFCGRCGSGESILKFANRPHRT